MMRSMTVRSNVCFLEQFGVVVEHPTSVRQAVGAKVMSSIPNVIENLYNLIYSYKVT